ncbi:protein NRT1/ PTR FAMILY 5.6-like [Salvia splendens]|nr:protein NRT1/ PTR FAMILY 5.6-like [Salvia splendens]
MEIDQSKNEESSQDKWVYDSCVDHKGRIPVRASTGAWKASVFIIVIEFSERLSYFGLATSLIIYLTKVLHYDIKTAAKSVNYWSGVTTLMPLFGGFLADSYLGRFSTVLLSSIVYLLGLIVLTMSRVVPALWPCGAAAPCSEPRKIHEVFFFLAIYCISVGTGGHKPSLESFGADQFDEDHPVERLHKMSFFNWWNSGLCCGLLLGVTVVVYVQDHVSWAAADLILTAVMALSILIFCLGRPRYRFRKPAGSPLTPLCRVAIAAFRKRRLAADQLHEAAKLDKGRQLFHTDKLRFLDKAAIVEAEKQSPWRLATVTEVEEMKLMINMIPIWITTLPFGICVAQSSTFFIKQSTTLDRSIAGGKFTIPPASTYALAAIGMIAAVVVYDKILVPFFRRVTGNERGINILPRIGIGMCFTALSMVVAAAVERKRLKSDSNSMSVFWLAPQFLIIGVGDGFALVGLQEYFYDQVPDSMRSLGIALYLSVIGAANFLSSLLITVVDRVTEKGGKSWFGKDLNSSRLDYFYLLLAGITTANLAVYAFVVSRYSYKNVRKTTVGVDDFYDADARNMA